MFSFTRFIGRRKYKFLIINKECYNQIGTINKRVKISKNNRDRFPCAIHFPKKSYNENIINNLGYTYDSENGEFDSNEIYLITAVGRLTNQKDFTNLINAFSLTTNSLDSIRLVIIGSGEQGKILQSLVKDLDLESKIEFLGFQPNPYKFMNSSDLFVMSS